MLKKTYISPATHSIAKSESRRAGVSMGEWLGAAAVAYAAQTDPTFLRMCQELYAALAAFGEAGGQAAAANGNQSNQ